MTNKEKASMLIIEYIKLGYSLGNVERAIDKLFHITEKDYQHIEYDAKKVKEVNINNFDCYALINLEDEIKHLMAMLDHDIEIYIYSEDNASIVLELDTKYNDFFNHNKRRGK